MYDFEIAFYLYKMARLQDILLDSNYRAKAYHSAAMAMDAHDNYVEEMYKKGTLQCIPYVGSKIEKCIVEIIETGELQELKLIEEEYKVKDYTLLLSSGLPDKLIKKLWEMSITTVGDLASPLCLARLKNELRRADLNKVMCFIHDYEKTQGRYLYAYGKCLGDEIVRFMRGIKKVSSVAYSGEMMSACEKITTIEISFSYNGSWDYLIQKLKGYSRIGRIQDEFYAEITGMTCFGIPVHLLCQNNAEDTSTKDNLIDVDLISREFIRGDLHSHTKWTDGIHTVEQMLQTAEELGHEYLAITDHSVSMRVAQGLSESQALSQIDEIRECEKKYRTRLLAGIEVDIKADGSLDYNDEILSQFDFVIAAIHSHMNQSAQEMEIRLQKALSNPYVNILAHPTGRLLGRPGVLFSERRPYEIELQRIIELCKEYHVALEVNCFPERLDLNAENAKMAVEQGVKLSLGTDAHSLAHLHNIEYGIRMLRMAGIDPNMVLNTYSYERLLDYFKEQKPQSNKMISFDMTKSKKDFRHYFGNNQEILQGKKTIIGIDLTGSEDKESGWAYMAGSYAKCKRIKSDSEIIESVVKLKPDIVSIDSPLAYPRGRCCSRKDCKCSKYGIMRESERMLRHFGLTVYPCLIDSMVNLTTRGMKLACRLREMGYTVIESYPGVAQDVLMIPRKGKTQEQFMHLKQGLASFGITGDWFNNQDISHDEVDAITSALVGYFYLNGQYVGLGNEDEDYLIVPRIQDELLKKHIVIGLCGETGAGKTTTAEYLRFKYGFKYFRYSQVIAEKYHITDKQELQKVGEEIADNEEEQRGLSKYMIQKMDPKSSYVIDGLRHYEDYDELKKEFGDQFVFVHIDCRYKQRSERYRKLKFGEVSEEKFRKINDHPAEKEIGLLQMRADYHLDNNTSYTDLRAQADSIIIKECEGVD